MRSKSELVEMEEEGEDKGNGGKGKKVMSVENAKETEEKGTEE
jgi:hypothetical protein